MKLTSILAFASLGGTYAFSLPRLAATKVLPRAAAEKRICVPSTNQPFSKIRGGFQLAEAADTAAEADAEEAASVFLSMLVVDAVAATKEIALNWGFVLNSGIVKIIGGCIALGVPFFSTEVALHATGLALTCVAGFNISGLFTGHSKEFKIQSFLVGLVQAFLAYRMTIRPFESLNVLTMLVAAAAIADGSFETAVAIQNSDLPGRWALLFSGLASMAGGAFVAANLRVTSLFVLGTLLGVNLISSGWSGILAALKGREIANAYLEDANFEKDAFEAITTAAA